MLRARIKCFLLIKMGSMCIKSNANAKTTSSADGRYVHQEIKEIQCVGCAPIKISFLEFFDLITIIIMILLKFLYMGRDCSICVMRNSCKSNMIFLIWLFSGFLIVAACVMTFEARDSATKIVPTATASQKEQVFTMNKIFWVFNEKNFKNSTKLLLSVQ